MGKNIRFVDFPEKKTKAQDDNMSPQCKKVLQKTKAFLKEQGAKKIEMNDFNNEEQTLDIIYELDKYAYYLTIYLKNKKIELGKLLIEDEGEYKKTSVPAELRTFIKEQITSTKAHDEKLVKEIVGVVVANSEKKTFDFSLVKKAQDCSDDKVQDSVNELAIDMLTQILSKYGIAFDDVFGMYTKEIVSLKTPEEALALGKLIAYNLGGIDNLDQDYDEAARNKTKAYLKQQEMLNNRSKEERLRARGWSEEKIQAYMRDLQGASPKGQDVAPTEFTEEEHSRYLTVNTVHELLEKIMDPRDSELAADLIRNMTEQEVSELIDLLNRVVAHG